VRWYVVQTLPHQELRAQHNLERQGFRVFCPKRLKTVRHARRTQTVLAPVFPGYLFVSLDVGRDRWRAISSTYGVARLICGDVMPTPVPEGVVETMADSVDGRGVLQFVDDLKIGGRVRLLAGPFAEQLGILDGIDANGSIRVLLNIMNGTVPIRVSRDHAMPE